VLAEEPPRSPATVSPETARWFLLAMCAGSSLAQVPIDVAPFWVDLFVEQHPSHSVLASWVVGLEYACAAISNIAIMPLMFRVSMQRLGTVGVLLMLTGSVICTFDQGIAALCLGRLAAGLGEGFLLGISQVMAAQTDKPDRAYAVMNVSTLVCAFVLLPIVPAVAHIWGAVGIFGLMSFCSAICLPAFAKLRGDSHAGVVEPPSTAGKGALVRTAAAFVAILITGIAVQGLWTYAVLAARRLDISSANMGYVMSLSLLFGLVGAALAAVLSTRVPQLALIALGVLLLGAATLLFGYAPNQFLYFAAICSLPFAYGVATPLLFGIVARIDPTRAAAAGSVASLMGTAIGSPLVGMALGHGAFAAFTIGNCAALLVALMLASFADRRDPELRLRVEYGAPGR
jgi:MFS family permease